jgi:hypothetical protein
MKQSALKKSASLQLVTASAAENMSTAYPDQVRDFEKPVTGRWPELVRPRQQYWPRPLTSEEFVRVEMATVREGYAHPVWPPDVFGKFLTAEVIRERDC